MLDFQRLYPSEDGNKVDREYFLNLIKEIVENVDKRKDINRVTLGTPKQKSDTFYSDIKRKETLPLHMGDETKTVSKLIDLIEGHPYSNRNYHNNFVPNPNTASLLGNFLMTLVNGNNIWDVNGPAGAEAEVRIITMMRKLLGSEYSDAGGYTTWGGQGAVFTALRLALAKYDPNMKKTGIKQNLYCFCSEVAHYSTWKSVEATGIGTDQLIKVKVKDDFSMCMDDLKLKITDVIKQGGVPLFIVGTVGTTDTFGIDHIREIKEVSAEVCNNFELSPPYIHADSALGGFYAFFNDYDFEHNQLAFEPEVLNALMNIQEKMQYMKLADSVCFDFHKLGQTPYTTSLFLTKKEKDLYLLDIESSETPYVGNRGYGSYHTGYTFECSRMASSIPIYASLLTLGVEGYQKVLANYIRVNEQFRKELSKIPNIAITNSENHGLITTFRFYPEEVIWEKERNGEATKEEIQEINLFNSLIYEELGKNNDDIFLGDTKKICTVSVINDSEEMPIYSAKFVCISPFTTTDQITKVIERLEWVSNKYNRYQDPLKNGISQ
ncbi:aspartate aminotransferase family protein [Bacillus shivajii]|uniref:pyridoxal phosphate-dependent decarboxylase family protein n=1 Tax=Bacillus shivajii TaxID=1983719 RepID=UPI001CF961E2|nr:pyridoxal-dependent decarboxylase [Bacillus shivajii]UCZ55015.1 aspartate aminotransferase family protein [Bacillus shivajii]